MKRPEFFSFRELTRTDTGLPNVPTWEQAENLNRLGLFLDWVRRLYGGPIRVNSGFRSPEVNRAVGGVESSAHLKGLAADIRADNMDRLYLCLESFTGRMEGMGLDQLIVYPKFVHVGLSENPRRQVIVRK